MENDQTAKDVKRNFPKVHKTRSELNTVVTGSAKQPETSRSEPPFSRSSDVSYKGYRIPTEAELHNQRAEVMTKLMKQLQLDEKNVRTSTTTNQPEDTMHSASGSTSMDMNPSRHQPVRVRPASESKICTLLNPVKEETIRKHLNSIGVTLDDHSYIKPDSSFKGQASYSRSYNVGNITVMEDSSINKNRLTMRTDRLSSCLQRQTPKSPVDDMDDEIPTVFTTFEETTTRKVIYPKSYIRQSWSHTSQGVSTDLLDKEDIIDQESEDVIYLQEPSTSRNLDKIFSDSNKDLGTKSNLNKDDMVINSLENLNANETECDLEQYSNSDKDSSQDSRESNNIIIMSKFKSSKSETFDNKKVAKVVEKKISPSDNQKIIYASVNENIIQTKLQVSYVPLQPVEEKSSIQLLSNLTGNVSRKASKRKLELETIDLCPKQDKIKIEPVVETPNEEVGLPSWAFVKSPHPAILEKMNVNSKPPKSLIKEHLKTVRYPARRVSKSARNIQNASVFQPSKVQSTPKMLNVVNKTEVLVHTVNKLDSSSTNVSSKLNNQREFQTRHRVRSRQRRSKTRQAVDSKEEKYKQVNKKLWKNQRVGEELPSAVELDDYIQGIEEDEIETDINLSDDTKVQCACFKSLGIAISQCIFRSAKRKKNKRGNR